MDGCGRVCGGFGMNNLVGLRKDLATENAENFRVLCGLRRLPYFYFSRTSQYQCDDIILRLLDLAFAN